MTSTEFKYRGFGVNIRSNIEFPELFPAYFDEQDIDIQTMEVDDPWYRSVEEGRGRQEIHSDTYRLQIPGVGRYLVCHGRLVKMASDKDADPTSFRLFALTYAMSACMIQRRQSLLHASGIILNGKVILFAGESGAGKSTVISRFYQKGYTIFTDDVCVLHGQMSEEGQMMASASYPLLKLESKTLARYLPDVHPMSLWPDSEKKGMGFHETFRAGQHPIACVIDICIDPETNRLAIEPLHGLRAFRRLAARVYRKSLIRDIGQQRELTRMLANLAGSTPVFSLSRPALPDDGSALSELLEEFILRRLPG